MNRKILSPVIFIAAVQLLFLTCSVSLAQDSQKKVSNSDKSKPFVFIVDFKIKPKLPEGSVFEAGGVCNANCMYIFPIRISPWAKGPVRYDIDCDSDGNYDYTGLKKSHVCIYNSPGPHKISIRGKVPGLLLGDELSIDEEHAAADAEFIKRYNALEAGKNDIFYKVDLKMGHTVVSVEQWGSIAWQSMKRMFKGCNSLIINANDAPNLKKVTDMSEMFVGAEVMNQNIEHWDISNVKDTSYMFCGAHAFNQPLNQWNTKNVVNMSHMFEGATSFNQPLNQWNTKNVTDMSGMFCIASQFNQRIDRWDVSNVTNMSSMFYFARDFNQKIERWDVSNVTNMSNMFYFARDFNQPLALWNTKNVTDMSGMFSMARSFNQPVSTWNVKNVKNMDGMFDNAESFNQPLDQWITHKDADNQKRYSGK